MVYICLEVHNGQSAVRC